MSDDDYAPGVSSSEDIVLEEEAEEQEFEDRKVVKRRKLDVETESSSKYPAMVTLRQDSKQILKHLEQDYKNDLAVHLFSAHLMHQMDETFPRKIWTSWPLKDDEVPDPKTSELFMDEDPEMILERGSTPIPAINEDYLELIEDRLEQEEQDEMEPVERSNPEEILQKELEALFKKKIYSGIHKLAKSNKDYYLQPSLEVPKYPDMITEKIKNKIDQLLNKFPIPAKYPLFHRGFYDWRDLIVCAGVNDEKFIQKAEKLFVEVPKQTLKEFKLEGEKIVSGDDEDEFSEGEEEENVESSEEGEEHRNIEKTIGKRSEDENSDESFDDEDYNEDEQPSRKSPKANNHRTKILYGLRQKIGALLYEEMKKKKLECDPLDYKDLKI